MACCVSRSDRPTRSIRRACPISVFRFSVASDGIDRTHRINYSIDGLLTRLLDAETGARGYLLTGKPEFLEPFNQAEPPVAAASVELANLVEDEPQQRERAQRLEALSRDRTNELREAVDSFMGGRTSEAVARMGSGVGRRLMDQIHWSAPT